MYLGQDTPTRLYEFDTSANPFIVNPVGPTSSITYNAIAYNPDDNYIYGLTGPAPGTLVRLGSDGSVNQLGTITNYPSYSIAGGFSPSGTYYVLHSNVIYAIDVTTMVATQISLSRRISGHDMAWHDGRLWTAAPNSGPLYEIDPVTGDVTAHGSTGVSGTFGGMFGATNGVFGSNNNGGFYRFNLTTGEATLISDLPGSGNNDGAKCVNTALSFPADTQITKDDDRASYEPGADVEYTIVVSNSGPFGVQGALVNDPLPAGITAGDVAWTCGSPVNGATCGLASGTGAISDVPVNLPVNGSVTFTLTMSVPADFTGDLVNTATVANPIDVPDADTSNNEATDTDVSEPRLTLEKVVVNDDGGTAQAADFTLTADGPTPVSGNSGQPEVTAVPVDPGTYTLGEVDFAGYTSGNYSCVVNGGTPVEGNTLTLALEDSAVCTITNDDEAATLTLEKTVTNDDGGVATVADFTLTATGPTNLSGPSGDPSVTDVTVPAGSYALSETGPGGYTAGTYRCSIDDAAPLASDTLDLDNGETAVCTVTNDDIAPDVTISKALTGESITEDFFPQDGEILTYEITLTNTGGTATDYEILDILDDNVSFLNASDGGQLVGSEVQWTVTVPAAQDESTPGELVLTVEAQVISPLPEGEDVVNIAKTPSEPTPACPSAQCVVIPPLPSVESEKQLVGESGGTQDGVAEPGEQLTYEITLSNVGSTTNAYDHRDLLDPNMIFVSADNSGAHDGSPEGGQIDWTDLTVPGGTPSAPGELVLTVVVDVVDSLPGGVSEIANLSYDPAEPLPECPSAQCVVVSVPGIIDKDKALTNESIASDGVAEPGEQLTYQITLTNTGGEETSYSVEDRMDPNMTFVSASDGGTESGGVVTWSGLTVPAYDAGTPGELVLSVTVEVDDPLPEGVTELTNIVAEPGENVDCGATPDQCVSINTAPQISKEKTLVGESGALPGVAEPGETLTYEITVTNQGGADPAYDLQDLLDPNTTFTGADNGGQLMGAHVAWTLSVPAHDGTDPGTRVVRVTVRVDDPLAAGVTQLTNIAREPGETIDCTLDPVPAECVVTPTGPRISEAKELWAESGETDGVAEAGEELTYRITLTNTGGVEHPAYELVDDYDANVTILDADGGTDDGDVITWTGLAVPPQVGGTPGTLVLSVVAQVDDPMPAGVSEISNVVHQPGESVDCTDTPERCVALPTQPQISRLKELVEESGGADGVAEPGETLTYRITLSNEGGPATDYAVYDVLDDNTSFASADNTGTHDGTASGGVVEWSGLAVPAQAGGEPGELVLTVSVTVNDPLAEGTTEIVNIVKEDPGDPDPACPTDHCVVIDAAQPGLTLVKEGAYEDTDGNGQASPGDVIRYTFTVQNSGNVPLDDVTPKDSGPTFDGQTAQNRLSDFTPAGASLQPDDQREFTATYTLGQTDIDNGAGVEDGVENTATALGYANGDQVTGTLVESEESAWVLALPFAASDITITKVALLRQIRRGEQAPFALQVANNAASRTDEFIVTDTIPPGFRYVEGSATVDGVESEPVVSGRNLRFEGLSLEGNGELEIRLRLLALSSAGPGEHVNRANVTDPGGNPLAREATAVVEILAEHVFDCGDIVGKVFDDVNRNGYQDEGEPGLPGVRVATVKGWLITTDTHGRFHVACADLPDQRIGSNFIMKLDERTLPTGYRVTTENPRVVRLTAGKMTKLNFGASIGRVVRLDLKDDAFVPGGVELNERWAAGVDQLIAVLAEERSILRLSYFAAGSGAALAEERLTNMKKLIAARWRERRGRYPLDIETRVEVGQ